MQRKHQFLGFVVILLVIGFLNYVRKISHGYKLSVLGKILFLSTMVTFTVGVMFILYFTEINNVLAFIIGLCVATLSEHIANLFIIVGNSFNNIITKIVKKYTGVDIGEDLQNSVRKAIEEENRLNEQRANDEENKANGAKVMVNVLSEINPNN